MSLEGVRTTGGCQYGVSSLKREGRRTSTAVVAGVEGADEERECATARSTEHQSSGLRR